MILNSDSESFDSSYFSWLPVLHLFPIRTNLSYFSVQSGGVISICSDPFFTNLIKRPQVRKNYPFDDFLR